MPYMRMTTDEPDGNLQTLLNYAYDNDHETYLRYAGGRKAVPLALYIELEAHKRGCTDVRREDIIDGDACFMCDDCPLAVLNAVATQAAELRARLKEYEDTGLSPADFKKARTTAELGAMIKHAAQEARGRKK